jgi:uncharacterized repeat protein (TIGR01451 family)
MVGVRKDRDRPRRLLLVAAVSAVVGLGLLTTAIAASTADLGVDTTDNVDPVRTGQLVLYSTTLTNKGPDAATQVRLIDKLPQRVEFVGVNASAGTCTRRARTVRCVIDTLASGDTARLSVRVRPTKEGTMTNTVTVDSRTPDPISEDNTDSEQTTVQNPEPVICGGRRATVIGTDGDDNLPGTDGNDVIAALGGNDTVAASGGNDFVCGSAGNDTIKGKGGDDSLRGGGGDDAMKGGGGADTVKGKGGNDDLVGGRGPDVLRGGGGADTCRGGSGHDEERGC